jgi:hypothetical protein
MCNAKALPIMRGAVHTALPMNNKDQIVDISRKLVVKDNVNTTGNLGIVASEPLLNGQLWNDNNGILKISSG